MISLLHINLFLSYIFVAQGNCMEVETGFSNSYDLQRTTDFPDVLIPPRVNKTPFISSNVCT